MINYVTDFECRNLTLKLSDKILFKDFQYKFSGPGIVQIEGENGTGKSSLLKVFAGLIVTENNNIKFSGFLPEQVGAGDFSFFTTTSLGLLSNLTGREHIELFSKAIGINSNSVLDKILEFQEMEIFNEILNKPVSDFSQGMKQFLRLFLHLFFQPKIVFLDEPFLYLSPKLKEFFQQKIELMASDSLIFITDQKFSWVPSTKRDKIILGEK
ncbi:MAG: ATP-binding cassette domain-containing protein [Bacteriovorax sp.]|jgi:ABC-type multidrug transport system ATPase subunit